MHNFAAAIKEKAWWDFMEGIIGLVHQQDYNFNRYKKDT